MGFGAGLERAVSAAAAEHERRALLPERIVERAVEFRGLLDHHRLELTTDGLLGCNGRQPGQKASHEARTPGAGGKDGSHGFGTWGDGGSESIHCRTSATAASSTASEHSGGICGGPRCASR